MTTKDTINKMEKELDEMSEKITDYGYNDEYGYYSDWKDGVSPIIKASIRTLLESFGEEMIGTKYECGRRHDEVGAEYDLCVECGAVDEFKAKQRLKMKEIISSIGK